MLIDPSSQTNAAIRAGYSPATATVAASKTLAKEKVKNAIEEGRKDRAERLGYTQDRILVELAKIAFADLKDAVRVDSEGNVTPTPLAEMSFETSTDKSGNKSRHVKVKTPKVADKQAALLLLGKHLGLFEDKIEVEHKGSLLDLIEASYKIKSEDAA